MAIADWFTGISPSLLIAIAAVFVLAGVIKGVVGLGLPTISMALLALMMVPAQAAILLIVPSLVTNLWQARPWNTLRDVFGRVSGLQTGIVIGTLTGAYLLGAPAGAWATLSLGIALVVYAGWGLFGSLPTISAPAERWLGPLVGLVTGFVTAATGVFVVPAVPYLQALGMKRDALIQAMGISFTVSTLALAGGLALNGSYSVNAAGISVVMLAPALIGMYMGQKLRQKLSPIIFKRCFLGSLAVLGIYQIIAAW